METIKLKENENAIAVPICLADNELYLIKKKEIDCGGLSVYIIRPVTKDELEYRRSEEGEKEYMREVWQMAVAGGNTESSLAEYVEEARTEWDTESDPEMFLYKDNSLECGVFDDYPELRKIIDDYLLENEDIEVGTWEDSACGQCRVKEEMTQIVFDEELWKRILK